MSTTSDSPESIGQLDLIEHSWLRVDIGDLGGADPRDALTGAYSVGFPIARADPAGKMGDLVGTYWAALFLVSPAFVKVLRDADLTGWGTVPIDVDGNADAQDLVLLQVRGRCGAVNETGRGRTLALSAWDGSDLFVPANELSIFLTPRAVAALRAARLTNVEVETGSVELI